MKDDHKHIENQKDLSIRRNRHRKHPFVKAAETVKVPEPPEESVVTDDELASIFDDEGGR